MASYCTHCEQTTLASTEDCEHCGAARPVEGWPFDSLIGGTFADDYRVIKRLGSGGFGVVYLAENREFGAKRALKILHSRYVHDDRILRRFKREAKALYRLQSPYTVRVERWGRSGEGHYYLIMEFAEGETLREVMAEAGALPVARALSIARQIAVALADANRLEIVHRDLKPSNIVIRQHPHEGDRVAVLDFGISKILSDSTSEHRSGVVGTPAYMAPEIWQPSLGEANIRADLWSLGLILYEMVTGELPFDSETTSEPLGLAFQACHLETRRVIGPLGEQGVDEQVIALIAKLLRPDPNDRFQQPDELLAAMNHSGGQSHATLLDPRLIDDNQGTIAVADTEPDGRLTRAASAAGDGFTFGDDPPEGFHRNEPKPPRDGEDTTEGGSRWGAVLLLVGLVAVIAVAAQYGDELLDSLMGGGASHPDVSPTPELGTEPEPETRTGADGVVLRLIEAGAFEMGSDELESTAPAHDVRLDSFYVDEELVTLGAWLNCVELGRCDEGELLSAAHPAACPTPDSDGEGPVRCVSWLGAQAYCRAQGRRLPSEAEWEYATASLDLGQHLHEWVFDWWAPDWYTVSPLFNPRGTRFGEERVVRGGPGNSAVTRGHSRPQVRRADLGFRCALDGE